MDLLPAEVKTAAYDDGQTALLRVWHMPSHPTEEEDVSDLRPDKKSMRPAFEKGLKKQPNSEILNPKP